MEYYEVRKQFNETRKPAFFYYLNKMCFNGLYRVNSHGQFNVPKGKTASGKVPEPDIDGLLIMSNFLNAYSLVIKCSDYANLDIPG